MISPSDILAAKILVVGDLEANILLLEQMLRGAGYVCVASTMDPHVVCELHSKNHYDVILLDLHMPGKDGFQVGSGQTQGRGLYLTVHKRIWHDLPPKGIPPPEIADVLAVENGTSNLQ